MADIEIGYKGSTITSINSSGVTTLNTIGTFCEDNITVTFNKTQGEAVTEKQVNFIDYDGTILYSYTKAEAEALTALPANPSHSGLVAQGWNWTLAEIKAQLTAIPDGPVWVGQMYITESGDTEIDCEFPEDRLAPTMSICVNGTVTIDWGDNTAVTTVTGTSLSTRQAPEHTYAAGGVYTIKIHVVSGTYLFNNTTTYTLLRKNTTANENIVYTNCIKAVRLGNGVQKIGDYAFYFCGSLTSITIPSGVTSINIYAFCYCYDLKSITIPSGITEIKMNNFNYCYSLARVSVPNSLRSIAGSAFRYCYSLTSITIPSGVTLVDQYVFSNCTSLKTEMLSNNLTAINAYTFDSCRSLKSIIIPDNVTSIGAYAFTICNTLSNVTLPEGLLNIGNYAFNYCQSLTNITIPSSVTSIGTYAFQGCAGMKEYHFLPTTPPTLSNTNAFSSIPSDCIIYVPSESLEDYQTATNWSTYASYMVGE